MGLFKLDDIDVVKKESLRDKLIEDIESRQRSEVLSRRSVRILFLSCD